MMRLRVLLPTDVRVDEKVRKVVAEGTEGAFCLLPRHVDIAAALVPGILAFETEEGAETFFAVDGGILTKCGEDVRVSTPSAVGDRPLGELERAVREEFRSLDERERRARSAVAKIEADFVRGFLEMQEDERA
jgi:F-type H+-transporting ATPase subunit epsilon